MLFFKIIINFKINKLYFFEIFYTKKFWKVKTLVDNFKPVPLRRLLLF